MKNTSQKMSLIYSTFPTKKEAKAMAKKLVKARAAACANIFPVESIYRWKNKVENDKEFAMLIKTAENCFPKIKKMIKKCHSYDLPCILELDVKRVEKKYLKWVNKNL